jgi:beta-glucosidase
MKTNVDLPYKNPELPIGTRIEDLLPRMSIEQKIAQVGCLIAERGVVPDLNNAAPVGIGHIGVMKGRESAVANADFSAEIQAYMVEQTELGIPALIHCEALSGGMFSESPVYPVAIGLASTWNPEKVREMAGEIRKQMYAIGFRHALSPVLDISRDPRWGRIGETYGEDAALASAMAVAYVQGIQGDDLTQGVAATAKHFIGHGAAEGGLNLAQGHITERDLREVHAKPFQAVITEAGLLSVMNAYGSINHEAVVSSGRLLTGLLRDEMGFTGMTVSDYVAIERLVEPFRMAGNYDEAGVLAMTAGIDVEYPSPLCFADGLRRAIDSGSMSVEQLDTAVRRVLEVKFKLGLFENPYPDRKRVLDAFQNERSEALSGELGRESIILLKNEGQTLPLSKQDLRKVAVIGPHAHSVRSLFGCYTYPAMLEMITPDTADGTTENKPSSGIGALSAAGAIVLGRVEEENPLLDGILRKEFPDSLTLYEAVSKLLPQAEVVTAGGCTFTGTDRSGFAEAVELARAADAVILAIGGKNGWGVRATIGEGIDAMHIGLPGMQEELAAAVAAAAAGKPTVVVHIDGRPLSSEAVAETFPAILEAWQPGMFGGEAIASALFGDYNPGGKLPVTAARSAGQLPVYYGLLRGNGYEGVGQTAMIVNPNGYIDGSAAPLYPFGHGLSYTAFEYSELKLSSERVEGDGELTVSVNIKNAGGRSGDEVVQLYISDKQASLVRPVKELVGFKRIALQPGEQRTAQFTLQLSQLAFLDRDMRWKVEAGEMGVQAGSSSADLRLSGSFTIASDAFVDGRTRAFYALSSVSGESTRV